MALVAWEGFDFCNNSTDIAAIQLVTVLGAGTPLLTAGRFGGKAATINGSGLSAYARFALPSGPSATVLAGAAIRSQYSAQTCQVRFYDTTVSNQCQFTVTLDTGLVTAYNEAGTSVGSATIAAWVPQAWVYLEAAVTIHPSAGTMQFWADGVLILNLTGINTRLSSNTSSDRVSWYFSGQPFQIDDMYLKNDLTPLGPVRVVSESMLSANGTPGFTPLTSTNVSQINETATDGDTTYNYSSTVGVSDVFNPGTLSASVNTVYGVGTVLSQRKDDVGARTTSALISSSGTIANGNTLSPGTNYVWYDDFFLVDPATGVAWTTAGFNAVKPGYRLIA